MGGESEAAWRALLDNRVGRGLKVPELVAETAAMLFWALMASGRIIMRKVDGWETLAEKPFDQIIGLAA
jgi:hypothetical protein